MLGDGLIQGSPVQSNQASRVQPRIATTARSAPSVRSPLNSRASSPSVRPWRIGIGRYPVKPIASSSWTGPSIADPPIGFGRSSTMTDTPCFAATSMT